MSKLCSFLPSWPPSTLTKHCEPFTLVFSVDHVKILLSSTCSDCPPLPAHNTEHSDWSGATNSASDWLSRRRKASYWPIISTLSIVIERMHRVKYPNIQIYNVYISF